MKAQRLLVRILGATAAVAASASITLYSPAASAVDQQLASAEGAIQLQAQAPAAPADATPTEAETETDAAEHTTQPIAVTVHSTSDTITPSDEEFLQAETTRLDFPDQVTAVDYIVFDTGKDNLNDTTLDYAETEAPQLLNNDRTKWAPGHLIVAVSMDPRRNGIYCGDDVCAALNLSGTSHLEGSLEAMKPSLRNNNVALGLFEGAKATIDPTITHRPANKDSKGVSRWWYLLGFGSFLALVGVTHRSGKKREKNPLSHRYSVIKNDWAQFAHELDDYDIRANSLTSVFADAKLRSEWEKLRDGFLSLNDTFAKFPDEPTEADLKPFSKDITDAGIILEQMRNARSNIDVLYDVEHGDASVRYRQVNILHQELQKALLTTANERHINVLEQLDGRVLLLRDDPENPRFLDELAQLIDDISVVTEEIATAEYSNTKKRDTPSLYSDDWWVGVGYHGYVPMTTWESWNSHDNASSHSDSSGWASSDVTSSYSSSSFSGGGGSSSW